MRKNYRKIYEKVHGPIPEGYHIHHIDGNHENNNIENLMAVTPEEHARLHKEMGLMWKGGDRTKWIVGASEAGKLGGKAKWKGVPEEEKIAHMTFMSSKSKKFTGKTPTKEHKEKLRQGILKYPMWTCPECGKEMRELQGNIKQHYKWNH